MVNLTFGEQVKIVLSRKGMTIKHLAEEIENKTGKKMSRQNLTQRLGRDNFQEKDMRMIAEILGCKFELNIMNFEPEQQQEKTNVQPQFVQQPEIPESRDLTLGEYVDMFSKEIEPEEQLCEPEQLEFSWDTQPEEAVNTEEPEQAEEQVYEESETQEVCEPEETAEPEQVEEVADEVQEEVVSTEEPQQIEEPALEKPAEEEKVSRWGIPREKKEDFQPIKRPEDEDEDRVLGDINPYTGREYRTNSVRMHPKRIGYVQVYDRKDHRWTDMTEWAFLGMEEKKKAELGRNYEPPIYLD